MTPSPPRFDSVGRSWIRTVLVVVAVVVGLVAVAAAGIGGAVDPGSFAFAAGSDEPGDRTHHEATVRLAEPSDHDGNWLDRLAIYYGDADVVLDGVAAEDVTVTVDGEDVEADHGNELAVSANDGMLIVDVRGVAGADDGDGDLLLQTALESGDQIEVTVAGIENPAAGEYPVDFVLRSSDSRSTALADEQPKTTASTTWTVGEPAAFAVADLSVENAVSGGEATLEAAVRNEGDLAGTDDVEFVVVDEDGEEVLGTESVPLDGGEETRVTVTAQLPEDLDGETEFLVRSSDDQVKETVDVESGDENDGADESDSDAGDDDGGDDESDPADGDDDGDDNDPDDGDTDDGDDSDSGNGDSDDREGDTDDGDGDSGSDDGDGDTDDVDDTDSSDDAGAGESGDGGGGAPDAGDHDGDGDSARPDATPTSNGATGIGGTATGSDVSVVDVELERETVRVGEAVDVVATLENDGGREGAAAVELAIDGEVVETREVEVAPGESYTIAFSITFAEAGTYEIAVNDVTAGSLAVESERTGSSEPQSASLPPLVALALGTLLVAGSGGYYLVTSTELLAKLGS